ncbi:uncharacterized protein I206_101921 [Kwoniella pini CBS 10737]|uniref:Uncharacterized protein n=1 Tax=Kwoniella pini CBS 10737 TaxID=1296096 RepID=A0A1B9HVB4_9TREE|nr:uncharacterized protein I206_06988 [Kwoniella pini CBS 10737]OCF47210.1 hypothetical protein I206_06988 [Kwoniella pini CBS 10737]
MSTTTASNNTTQDIKTAQSQCSVESTASSNQNELPQRFAHIMNFDSDCENDPLSSDDEYDWLSGEKTEDNRYEVATNAPLDPKHEPRKLLRRKIRPLKVKFHSNGGSEVRSMESIPEKE